MCIHCIPSAPIIWDGQGPTLGCRLESVGPVMGILMANKSDSDPVKFLLLALMRRFDLKPVHVDIYTHT